MSLSNPKNTTPVDFSRNIFALVVVVIFFGVSASLFFNAVKTARRMAATANLTEIGKGYSALILDGAPAHILTARPGDTAHTIAALLALDSKLNDANIWMLKSDPKRSGHFSPSSVLAADANAKSINPDFANQTLGYEVAANLNLAPTPQNPAPAAGRIPIAWTRGLRDDGTWAPDSPWQGEGGQIAFLDGHVQWFSQLGNPGDGVPLVKYGTNVMTANIHEALPPGAIVLSADPAAPGNK